MMSNIAWITVLKYSVWQSGASGLHIRTWYYYTSLVPGSVYSFATMGVHFYTYEIMSSKYKPKALFTLDSYSDNELIGVKVLN